MIDFYWLQLSEIKMYGGRQPACLFVNYIHANSPGYRPNLPDTKEID